MNNPKILIGTLFSGENELEECIESVKKQTYQNLEHIVIKNLPNKLAHDTLYKQFMDNSNNFQLFVKLDADMIFNTNKALEIIVNYFNKYPDLDHMVTLVDDRYSNTLIQGLHVFSNRASWKQNTENLFVDYNPIIPGKKIVFKQEPSPLVQHCPNPSAFQAYHFGVHRALKAFQPKRVDFNGGQSWNQWKLIKKVHTHFLQTKNIKLGFCILGVNHVFEEKIVQNDYAECKNSLESFFDEFENLELEELNQLFNSNWNSSLKADFLYLKQVYTRVPGWYFKRFKRLVHKLMNLF